MLPAGSPEFDGNDLIARLKEKSEENREKNDSTVRQKTLHNKLVRFLFWIRVGWERANLLSFFFLVTMPSYTVVMSF